jgi:hypothetical protein
VLQNFLSNLRTNTLYESNVEFLTLSLVVRKVPLGFRGLRQVGQTCPAIRLSPQHSDMSVDRPEYKVFVFPQNKFLASQFTRIKVLKFLLRCSSDRIF